MSNELDLSKFNAEQRSQIRRGLEKGLDVSVYAQTGQYGLPVFNEQQMGWILFGLEKGLDVSLYANPRFSWRQMEETYYGLGAGLDVSIYTQLDELGWPKFDSSQMGQIRKGLEDGLDVSTYANPTIPWPRMSLRREALESQNPSTLELKKQIQTLETKVISLTKELALHRSRTEAMTPEETFIRSLLWKLRNPLIWREIVGRASIAAIRRERFSMKQEIENLRARKGWLVDTVDPYLFCNTYTATLTRFLLEEVPEVEPYVTIRPCKTDKYFKKAA